MVPQPTKTLLFDARGNPMRSRASAYEAANIFRPDMAGWFPSGGSADADLLPELDLMRRRSRDMARNHPMAAGAIQTILDHVLCSEGLKCVPMPDYHALGKTKQWAVEWSRRVRGLFAEWSETTACDAARQTNLAGLARQALRCALESGEALGLVRWTPGRGSRWATCLQVVEPDRLCNPDGQADSNSLRGGVAIDQYGAAKGYWIMRQHPGDAHLGLSPVTMTMDRRRATLPGGLMTPAAASSWGWDWWPAMTPWGRRRVLHLYNKERPGQSRNKPALSALMPHFRLMDKLIQTELQAAIVTAMIALFIETPLGRDGLMELFGDEVDGLPVDVINKLEARRQEARAALRPGGIYSLYPGEKAFSHTPNRPAGSFAPVMQSLYSMAGAGIGLPAELLLKDFRNSNFSSARMMLGEAGRFFGGIRAWHVFGFNHPGYELWLEEAVNAGVIEAPGFYDMRFAYSRSRWIGKEGPPVDQLKEEKTTDLRLAGHRVTMQDVLAAQGTTLEDHAEQVKYEKQYLEEMGLGPAEAEAKAGKAL